MEGAGEAPWLCEGGCAEGGVAASKEVRLLKEGRDRANSLLVLRDKRIADLQSQVSDLQHLLEQQQEQHASLRTNGNDNNSSGLTDNGRLALCWRPPATEGEKIDSMHSSLTEGEHLTTDLQVEQQLAANIDVLASRLADAEADSEAARDQTRSLRGDVERLQGLLLEARDAREANEAVIENLKRRLEEFEEEAKELKLRVSRQGGPTQHGVKLQQDAQQQHHAADTSVRLGDTSTREVACMTAPSSPSPADQQLAWQSRLQLSRLENELSEKGILIRELQGHLATARHECHLKDETLDKVEGKLQALRGQLVDREERREYLEQQLVALQRQLALEHAHKQELAAQVTSKGDLLRKLERENWSLAGQLNAKTAGADTLQLTADHVAGELISRDREVMEQRLTIASLQEALVATKQTCDVLRARLDEDFEESRQEIDFLRRENSSIMNQLENLRNDISSATLRENELRQNLSALQYHQANTLRSTNNGHRHNMRVPASRTDQLCEEDEYNYEDEDLEHADHVNLRNDKDALFSSPRSFSQNFVHQRANRNPNEKCTLRDVQTTSGKPTTNVIRGNSPYGRQSTTSQLPPANTADDHTGRNNARDKTTNMEAGRPGQDEGMPLDDFRGMGRQDVGVKGQHVRWQQEGEQEEDRRPPLGWIPVPRRVACDVTKEDGGQKHLPSLLPRPSELWESQHALAEAQQERSHAHEQVLSLLRECNTLEEQIEDLMLENSRLTEESSTRAALLEEGRRQATAEQQQAKEESNRLKQAVEQAIKENVRLRKEFQTKCEELESVQRACAALEVAPGSNGAKNARHASGCPDEETGPILPREGEVSAQAIGTPDAPKNFPPRDRLDEKPPLPPQQINDADGRRVRRKTSHGNTNLEGEPPYRDDHLTEGGSPPIQKWTASVGTSTGEDGQWLTLYDIEQLLVKRESFNHSSGQQSRDGSLLVHANGEPSESVGDTCADNLSVDNKKQLVLTNDTFPSSHNICSDTRGNDPRKEAPLSNEDSLTSGATRGDNLSGEEATTDFITDGSEKSRGEALSSEADQPAPAPELEESRQPTLEQEIEWRDKLAAIRGECERVLREGLVLKESNTKLKDQVASLDRVVRHLRAQQRSAADRLQEALQAKEELASAVSVVVGGLRSWAAEVSGQLTVWAEAQDEPSKHLMLLHTEKRVLADRNAALQHSNTELRQLLQSFGQTVGNEAAHHSSSSLSSQDQNGLRTVNLSGHLHASYDFSGNRDSGVHDDVINSGGSETSNQESRKEDDDSARGSTHSSNVSCGSLEEHLLTLDQLEPSTCDESLNKLHLNLKSLTGDGKLLGTTETDFSEESSSPGTKGSPSTLRKRSRSGSSHVMVRSEVVRCSAANRIDWSAPGGEEDHKGRTLGQDSAKSKKTFAEYRQDLERLITLANSLLKSTRRILRASRVDAAPRLRCSASLQDLRNNLPQGTRSRSFSASRVNWSTDARPRAFKEDISEAKTPADTREVFGNEENLNGGIAHPGSYASSDDLILNKIYVSSGLSATPTPSGGGVSPYYSDDLCDTCRMKNMEKAVAKLSTRLDGGSPSKTKLGSLGTITENNNNRIKLIGSRKAPQPFSMAKELQEIQAIIQTNASLVTSIRSLTQGSPSNLDLGWSVSNGVDQINNQEEFEDVPGPDEEGQVLRRASLLLNSTSNTSEKSNLEEDKVEPDPKSNSLSIDFKERTNENESGLVALIDFCDGDDRLANDGHKSEEEPLSSNCNGQGDFTHYDETVIAPQNHQQVQQQLNPHDDLQLLPQTASYDCHVLIDGHKRTVPRPRRRGKGSLTTLL